MRFIGGKSGFKTFRDLISFFAGLSICYYHIATTPAANLNVTVLIIGAGLAGLPSVFKRDEKK